VSSINDTERRIVFLIVAVVAFVLLGLSLYGCLTGGWDEKKEAGALQLRPPMSTRA